MLLRTHLMIGVFVLFFILPLFYFSVFFAFAFIIATLFVDIDSKKSRIGNHWYLRPLQWMTKHRGIFHSLFVAAILSTIIFVFNNYAGFGFFLGYLIHLLLDCMTERGCKIFWPVFDFKLRFFIKSGGIFEEVLFVLFLLSNLWLAWRVLSF